MSQKRPRGCVENSRGCRGQDRVPCGGPSCPGLGYHRARANTKIPGVHEDGRVSGGCSRTRRSARGWTLHRSTRRRVRVQKCLRWRGNGHVCGVGVGAWRVLFARNRDHSTQTKKGREQPKRKDRRAPPPAGLNKSHAILKLQRVEILWPHLSQITNMPGPKAKILT